MENNTINDIFYKLFEDNRLPMYEFDPDTMAMTVAQHTTIYPREVNLSNRLVDLTNVGTVERYFPGAVFRTRTNKEGELAAVGVCTPVGNVIFYRRTDSALALKHDRVQVVYPDVLNTIFNSATDATEDTIRFLTGVGEDGDNLGTTLYKVAMNAAGSYGHPPQDFRYRADRHDRRSFSELLDGFEEIGNRAFDYVDRARRGVVNNRLDTGRRQRDEFRPQYYGETAQRYEDALSRNFMKSNDELMERSKALDEIAITCSLIGPELEGWDHLSYASHFTIHNNILRTWKALSESMRAPDRDLIVKTEYTYFLDNRKLFQSIGVFGERKPVSLQEELTFANAYSIVELQYQLEGSAADPLHMRAEAWTFVDRRPQGSW